MGRRRHILPLFFSAIFLAVFCVSGSAKDTIFDNSRSTVRASTSLIIPPQPRDYRGRLTCTKDRYIQGEQQIGVASWYGHRFQGGITASGLRFDKEAMTLAHLTLPMGTYVRVENPINGRVVYARVTDCGPYVEGRIADLSEGLARRLGVEGIAPVIIRVL